VTRKRAAADPLAAAAAADDAARGQERRGVAASPGIVIGPAYVLRREHLVIPEFRVGPGEADAEVERLDKAFRDTRSRLREVREGMEETGLVGDIFDAQFLFLEDPTLIGNATRNIREGGLNAEWALQRELRSLQAQFEAIADPYIRERSSDVGFVVRRVLQSLMGREPEGLRNAPAGVIVVAEDLSPAELAQVSRGEIAGFLTEGGSRTSHVTIIARSLGIPAVVGVGSGLLSSLTDGTTLVVDGRAGKVLVDPDTDTVAEYEQLRSHYIALERQLLRYVDLPAETRDGVTIRMMANVDKFEEIEDAINFGAEGIGLFRTEFMFMNRSDLPQEDEQVEVYQRILEAVGPRSAVIRTLDLGGEKLPSGLDLHEEPNPALGLRGVRLSEARPDTFRVQLRALLRASAGAVGNLKILVPMVSNLSEVTFARREIEQARREATEAGHAVGDAEFGVMIETPAAAMISDLIAPHADFLSVGTNDLLQYTLAVDRTNDQVAYLYEPLHPANLRMVQRICQAGRRAGIVVGMCGEMAGDPLHCWILMAMGIGELSMAPFAIPLLKKILRESTAAEAREMLGTVLGLPSAAAVRDHVMEGMRSRFPLEFETILPSG